MSDAMNDAPADLPVPHHELDARGLRCPEPLMLVRNRVMDMASGEVLRVLATDPSTTWDLQKYCTFLRHELLHQAEQDGLFIHLIRKG